MTSQTKRFLSEGNGREKSSANKVKVRTRVPLLRSCTAQHLAAFALRQHSLLSTADQRAIFDREDSGVGCYEQGRVVVAKPRPPFKGAAHSGSGSGTRSRSGKVRNRTDFIKWHGSAHSPSSLRLKLWEHNNNNPTPPPRPARRMISFSLFPTVLHANFIIMTYKRSCHCNLSGFIIMVMMSMILTITVNH